MAPSGATGKGRQGGWIFSPAHPFLLQDHQAAGAPPTGHLPFPSPSVPHLPFPLPCSILTPHLCLCSTEIKPTLFSTSLPVRSPSMPLSSHIRLRHSPKADQLSTCPPRKSPLIPSALFWWTQCFLLIPLRIRVISGMAQAPWSGLKVKHSQDGVSPPLSP